MKSKIRKTLFIGCVLAITGLLVNRAAQSAFSANPYTKVINSVHKTKGVTVEFRSVTIEGAIVRMFLCYSLPPTKAGADYGLKDVTIELDGQKLSSDRVVMADLKQWIHKDDKDVMSGKESTTMEGSKKW
ncbi:MAG: hypothetical protein HC853_06655 [Anaerolineae bacterium]|nr:hypothetical protein [Anaerolineae bacterium]